MKRYTVSALLKAYREKPGYIHENKKLTFTDMEGEDVYNPAYPLMLEGKLVLPARVEQRKSEVSKIVMFEQDEEPDTWNPIFDFPSPPLQDPFWIQLENKLLLGGVHVDFSPSGVVKSWKTHFLEYNSPKSLRLFLTGPKGMKDLRICPLPLGKIALFTRPQGKKKGGRGQIGFSVLDSLGELTNNAIDNAPILELFSEEEWGGVNHVQVLADGNLGVLGHIACFSSGLERHYYPMAFVLDPLSGNLVKEPSIILERRELKPGPSKRPDLADVIFPGGCIQGQGTSTLYLGVGDAEVQKVILSDVFAYK